ncbi:MAG: non-homologous end-joining DNA ligase, partial [Acidobacteriota bacterium]|nr:non-homologous end-joining DNA ligase [Acidobacteriota bacterium]
MPKIPFRARPMLATLSAEPFDGPGWVFEEKYDGYRLLAYKEGSRVTLLSRNDKDKTAAFPAIATAISALPARTLLLDGEAVAFDAHSVSRFQFLQRGGHAPSFAAFDCLYVNGRDLRPLPQSERRMLLEKEITGAATIFPSRTLASTGLKAFVAAKKRGLEGVLAKDRSAPYVEGRSKLWLKWKVHQEEECVIAGYTAPAGSRSYFGALLLGAWAPDGLHFIGKVGTGFTGATLASLHKVFGPLVRATSPFVDPPRDRDITWLSPKL